VSYQALYAHCQTLTPHIHRNEIRDKAKALTGVASLAVMKTGLDVAFCRGFYLSARNTEHRLVIQHGGHVIILAREGLNRCWERFVFIKELMHLFDDPEEATDTGDQFEKLLAEFMAPGAAGRSPQMNSEIKCFWMALGVLCPEPNRLEFQAEREKGQIDDYSIALRLRIPEQYVPSLFHPEFLAFMRSF